MSAFSMEKLSALLRTQTLGRGEMRYEAVTDSTNKAAKLLATEGAPHGSAAVCDAQTAGRGRLSRAWYAEAEKSLLFSLVLTPFGPPETLPLYTLCAATAMTLGLRELCETDVSVKWPNDLLIGGKKLCGMLCEGVSDGTGHMRVIVGVGLNVHEDEFPGELSDRAISLRMALNGCEPGREACLAVFLQQMERLLTIWEQEGFAALLSVYEPLCATLGSKVRVMAPAEEWTGTAEAISTDGRLLVRTPNGVLRAVTCGDVSIRGMFGYADEARASAGCAADREGEA